MNWLVIVVAVALLAVEAAVRAFLRFKGISFQPPKTCREFYMSPHPYLPYVYRSHVVIGNAQVAPYPLHRGRYEFRPVRINNIRFYNEDVQSEKQPGTRRVMCLGSSSTANSIWEIGNPKEYSYPLCLREALAARCGPGRHEVLNCGMGGWTTAEIFINFALHLIDLRPDVVVLYHGLNDLEASLTAPFAADYSHSRRNLGESYARLRVASYIPNLRHWKSYFYLKRALLGFGNIRYDLLRSVRAKRPDFDAPFMGLATERRNVEHLIHLCRAHDIQVVLCTYAYHVYDQVRQDKRVLRYCEGIQLENGMLHELAEKYDLPLADLATLIPDDDAYFVDTVHFTPEGCRLVAEHLAGRIADLQRAEPAAVRPLQQGTTA